MSETMKTSKWTRFLFHLILLVLCLLIILPFLHILALAFNSGKDAAVGGIWFWPRAWSFENFAEVFKQDNLLTGLGISIFRTVVGTVIGVFLMAMCAWALTIPGLPFSSQITFFIFFTMLFSGGTVPYYLVLSELGLTNSIWVYILPSLYSVTNILLLRSSFKQLPMSIMEAARIDGMGEFKIFTNIVLPMSKPTVATVALFTAVGHWNDWFSGSFYVRKAELKPLATILQEMLTRQASLADVLLKAGSSSAAYQQLDAIEITGQSLQMATIIVVILPIIVMYPFIQKYFVQGITIGSVKE
ncbi:carbohydrate ABC transporter permease [Ignavigranum ruoffiae]|uniref:Carbohydrate ABC transporter membrane protein 2, CUT1 family n=1 Tax=Ignavigranum ruoffiae TaxID=89093 RepID=A0A1H9FDP9_9LACT|nr:carbohydrate ABC transporter permease [Ignavigranum ruoffiae]UPQ86578.1 carbohydrate ABC transporter permease [Ignavigranum ruoffiae]SEQ36044.1 carbohydrate ABC transporter membrane protein 2, CUT1 family [Ignavigranum ruoffiae]